MERNLIIRFGGLGDVLMLLPLVKYLHQRGQAEVILAVPGWMTELLSRFEGVTQTLDYESLQLWRLQETESGTLPNWPDCDRVIAFMKKPDTPIENHAAKMGLKTLDLFPPFPESGYHRHVSRYYLESATGASSSRVEIPSIHLDPGDLARARQYQEDAATRPFWVIQPGSGSVKKNWPLSHFLSTAVTLSKAGRRVVFLLGPAESSGGDFQQTLMKHWEPESVLEDLCLTDIAGFLSQAEGYLGNDSGVTHLSALMGVPTTAVFGPTESGLWGPVGPRVQVVREEGDPWPTPNQVLDAVRALLPDLI